MPQTLPVVISNDLLNDTIEQIAITIEKTKDYRKGFDRGVEYIKIRSYNTNDSGIRKYLLNRFTTKPVRAEGEEHHDFAKRVGAWKKSMATDCGFISAISKPMADSNKGFLIKLSAVSLKHLVIALLVFVFMNVLLEKNRRYTIRAENHYYLNNVSQNQYDLFIKSVEMPYRSNFVTYTSVYYFGEIKTWVINYVYLGYFIISILFVLNKNKIFSGNKPDALPKSKTIEFFINDDSL